MFGLLFCAASMWMGVVVARPFLNGAVLKSVNDDVDREIQNMKINNQTLTRNIKARETQEGIEATGRMQGYLYPNERPLNIPE